MRAIKVFALISIVCCSSCNTHLPSNFLPNVTVQVSPPSATLAVGGQQQFTAVVTGTSMTAVTWSVAGVACSVGPGCGSITTGGLYTAPSSVPSPNQITIQADSQANALDFGTANVVIMGGAVAALQGSYAFMLLGSDAAGSTSLTGIFQADSTGLIHAGEMTLCREVSSCTKLAFEGKYKMTQKDQGEIVLDVFPEAVMRFAQGEEEEVKLALDGKNDFHAMGTMTRLAQSGLPNEAISKNTISNDR